MLHKPWELDELFLHGKQPARLEIISKFDLYAPNELIIELS